uniref:Uncharacterized protein n=1 Tax=Sphaerodactylus townsendi TaxID=933632 RepID=A0ACB8GDQ5_9SAUR
MGTACSSSSSARRWRRSRWCSGSSSAPSRPSQPEVQEAGARCNATPAEAPLPPLGEPDSDSELLDQVLAECDADGPGQLQLPPRHPSRLAVHSSSSPAGGAAWEQSRGDRQIEIVQSAVSKTDW